MNGGGREGLVTEVANKSQQARQATCLLSGSHSGAPDLEGVGDAQSRARDAAPWPAGLGDYSARPLGRVGPPHLVGGSRWRRRLVSGAGPAARLPLGPAGRRPRPRDQPRRRAPASPVGRSWVKHPALAGGGAGGPGPTLIGPSRSREANGSPS